MKYYGKLPRAVVGELQHVINNKLGSIILNASILGEISGTAPQVGIRSAVIELVAHELAIYVRSIAEKEDWNSNPFESDEEKVA